MRVLGGWLVGRGVRGLVMEASIIVRSGCWRSGFRGVGCCKLGFFGVLATPKTEHSVGC